MPSTTTSNSIQPVQPDVVYAHVVQSTDADLGNHQLYANVPPSNGHAADDSVIIYSELLGKDNDVHTVAPSGDLYAQVQKRNTLYPT